MRPNELARRHALRRWQRAAGPFAPLVSATPFLTQHSSVSSGPAPVPPPWAEELAHALRGEAASGRPLAVVDRPAVEALAAAPTLVRRGIAVAPVMRRWPFPDGLLPAAPLLDALLRLAPLLRRPGRWRAAVLLVEAERLAPTVLPLPSSGEQAGAKERAALRTAVDNRYDLDALDLPPAAWLRAVGIDRVLAVVPMMDSGPAQPAPDLTAWLRGLAVAGIPTLLLPFPDALPDEHAR